MAKTYQVAAADVGGTGGKVAVAAFDGRRLDLLEEYTFPNHEVYAAGALYWDALALFAEIGEGLARLRRNAEIRSLSVDTWGVDFGLVDSAGRLMGNVFHMRDFRTKGVPEQVFNIIPERGLFYLTASDCSRFYALYQLYEMKQNTPYVLKNARALLYMADLLQYFFTGEIGKSDITVAGTSQLLDGSMTGWATEVFERIGLPHHYLRELGYPGETVGKTADGIDVIRTAGHDSAAAVACLPADIFYVSGGTYLVTGFKSDKTILNDAMIAHGFKNTTGPGHDFLVYKNVTGFWTLKEVMDEMRASGKGYSYGEMVEMAEAEQPFRSLVNINRFAEKKPSMIRAIQEFCRDSGQEIPDTPGRLARCLYESYAMQVKDCFLAAREISGRARDRIYVVNGAAKNALLCQMIADAAGVPVLAGLPRATILGNAGIQMIAGGEIADLAQLAQVAERSAPYAEYLPKSTAVWDEMYTKLRAVVI